MHINLMGVGRLFYGQLLQGLPAFHQVVNGEWASGRNTETLNVLHRAWQYRYPHVTKGTDDKSSPNEKKRQPVTVAFFLNELDSLINATRLFVKILVSQFLKTFICH